MVIKKVGEKTWVVSFVFDNKRRKIFTDSILSAMMNAFEEAYQYHKQNFEKRKNDGDS